MRQKIRHLFAELAWDQELVPWLNAAMLDHLDLDLLEEYLDALRCLFPKVFGEGGRERERQRRERQRDREERDS